MCIKPIHIVAAAALWFPLRATPQNAALWTSVKFTGRIAPRWELLADQSLRIYTDDAHLRRYASSLQLSYALHPQVRAGANVCLIRFHRTDDAWETRTRLFAYVQGSTQAGRIELSLYERFQSVLYTSGAPRKDLLRSRLTAALPLAGGRCRPRLGIETRYTLTAGQLDEWRFTAGNRIRLSRHHAIDTFVHCFARPDTPHWRWTTALGIDYIYTF